MMLFRASFTKLMVLTIVLAIAILVANYSVALFKAFETFTWSCLAFFFIVTVATLYMGLKGLEKSSHGFVATVNGIVMIKLFLSVGLVIGYLLLAKPNNGWFILPFFVFYIVFTVFEIRELLKGQKLKAAERRATAE